MKFYEKANRSLIKAITFRFLIIATDAGLIYLLTRRLDLTVLLVSTATISHTAIYFLHERAWNKIHWGKKTNAS